MRLKWLKWLNFPAVAKMVVILPMVILRLNWFLAQKVLIMIDYVHPTSLSNLVLEFPVIDFGILPTA